jgi:hypothetical protein
MEDLADKGDDNFLEANMNAWRFLVRSPQNDVLSTDLQNYSADAAVLHWSALWIGY